MTKRGWYRCEECRDKHEFFNLLDAPYEIVRHIKGAETRWCFCSIKCLKAWVEKQTKEVDL